MPICPLCKVSARKAFIWNEYTIWRCAQCTLRFVWPLPLKAELQQYHSIDYYSGHNMQYQETDQLIYAQISKFVLRNSRCPKPIVLDFGCATGGLWETLPSYLREAYIGIEPNNDAREQATKKTKRPVYASLRNFEKDSGTNWDICIMNQAVEHLRDPLSELSLLCKTGADDARLFLATPNFNSLRALLLGKKWTQYQNRTHLYFFTFKSCQKMLWSAGFSDVKRCTFYMKYPNIGQLRRAWQRPLRLLKLDVNLTVTARVRSMSSLGDCRKV